MFIYSHHASAVCYIIPLFPTYMWQYQYIAIYHLNFKTATKELCYSVKRSWLVGNMNFKFKYNSLGWFFVSAMPTGRTRLLFPAFAQFSLFCLALFPFSTQGYHLLVLLLFSPKFALQVAPETFSFYHELYEALCMSIAHSNSNTSRYYITSILNFLHGFQNVLGFSLKREL